MKKKKDKLASVAEENNTSKTDNSDNAITDNSATTANTQTPVKPKRKYNKKPVVQKDSNTATDVNNIDVNNSTTTDNTNQSIAPKKRKYTRKVKVPSGVADNTNHNQDHTPATPESNSNSNGTPTSKSTPESSKDKPSVTDQDHIPHKPVTDNSPNNSSSSSEDTKYNISSSSPHIPISTNIFPTKERPGIYVGEEYIVTHPFRSDHNQYMDSSIDVFTSAVFPDENTVKITTVAPIYKPATVPTPKTNPMKNNTRKRFNINANPFGFKAWAIDKERRRKIKQIEMEWRARKTFLNIRRRVQKHPFHLVDNSPWPILISYALMLLTINAVTYFNSYKIPIVDSLQISSLFVFISLTSVILIISLWFRDVTAEGTYIGNHTIYVQKGLIIGILLFIISEIFFFVSIFWAYLHSSLSPAVEIGTSWPPIGVSAINPFELPLLNTLLLLSSGALVTWSHHGLIQGNRSGAILGLKFTLLFAVLFVICQAIEYYSAPFTMSDGVFGSTFYISTGFHGAHVMLGTTFLMVCSYRLIAYHFNKQQMVGYESGIYYWHIVDVVWLGLYIIVYWWTY